MGIFIREKRFDFFKEFEDDFSHWLLTGVDLDDLCGFLGIGLLGIGA